MKISFLILSFSLCSSLNAGTHYCSPSGTDSGPGTIKAPWLTWKYAFQHTSADDTCYFRGGVYNYTADENVNFTTTGSAGHWVCFFNYPGERPILDCSNKPERYANYGIQFTNYVSYVHFKGLEIRNVIQQNSDVICSGITYDYADHVIFENISCHDIGGPGFACGNSGIGAITFINCDSYNNYDPFNDSFLIEGIPYHGGGATGFTMSSNDTSSTLLVKGCRAWNNSDGGFSFTNQGTVVFENCWAFNNGYDEGDGNGFKGFRYGDTPFNTVRRTVMNCIAAGNRVGFDQNNDPDKWVFYNNIAYHNGYERNYVAWHVTGGYMFYIGELEYIFRNNVSLDNYSGDNISINAANDHNSWNGDVIVSSGDFKGLDISELSSARKADGSLPDVNFGHLAVNSDLIDAGIEVGLPYSGTAPDLGTFETNLNGNPGAEKIKIYPNPVHDDIYIEINDPAIMIDFYRIIDGSGRVVAQKNIDSPVKNFHIPVNHMVGIFFIQLGSESLAVYTQKLIILSNN